MKRVRLTSSMMTSAGYDATTRTLEIEFANGGIYQYLDVPEEHYQLLITAPSQGRVFHLLIRNAHRHRRLELTQ
ncbi:MAG: KTSC domain-containing protein [Polyangiaceae bacterium]|nr:KTSC domain-containing protein [Polyangiaceae bacterium]